MERKRLAILKTLRDAANPLSSKRIAGELLAGGHDISERTVRFYLKLMDEDGVTENVGKKGRIITQLGQEELSSSKVIEKVGFLSAKIDQMACRMEFDLAAQSGTVVLNMTVLRPDQLAKSLDLMIRVFQADLAMGRLVGLFEPGERVGDTVVPEGMVGVGTVCSITLNGVLLRHGIPTTSRFGGLLEIRDRQPTKFVEVITYEGTSVDPLEVFCRSGMTDIKGAVTTGNGRIGASFREFPAVSLDKVTELGRALEQVGLGGLLKIGWPGQPLLGIPVHEGRIGAIIIGGLNPVAVVEEMGERIHSRALEGIVDYDRLFPYTELEERMRRGS
jgi:repressor of nif and glnA expression